MTVSGFSALTRIDGSFIFPALDSIRGDLTIQNNNRVETISGFAELDSVEALFK